MIVIVFGVAGSGKTTVGRLLAERAGFSFIDADDHHPPENIAKMRSGSPLTDEDREGWLTKLRTLLLDSEGAGHNVVLACSALKSAYREKLTVSPAVRFVYLKADPNIIAARLAARPGHFMPANLIESQFATLEEPQSGVITIDATLPPDAIVDHIISEYRL
ncbi:MAG: gluconokinase [Pyrinomonadaceae bacterium]|nr:gluconokinase [Pyrinomonadaceae bacterium]